MNYSFQEFCIRLERRKIKNIYLSIDPQGQIRLRVPKGMTEPDIEHFLEQKVPWIRQKLAERPPLKSFEWRDGEVVLLMGKKYYLKLSDEKLKWPIISVDQLIMTRETIDEMTKKLDGFYRFHLQAYLDRRVPELAQEIDQVPNEWRIKKMRTRWGSCNPKARRIWLSLELAKKEPELIDYVIVHELSHFIEGGHNKRFYGLLDEFMPDWSLRAKQLKNRLDG